MKSANDSTADCRSSWWVKIERELLSSGHNLSSKELLVYLGLRAYVRSTPSGEIDRAYVEAGEIISVVGREKLARGIALSPSTVDRSLRDLERRGWIEIIHCPGQRAIYRLGRSPGVLFAFNHLHPRQGDEGEASNSLSYPRQGDEGGLAHPSHGDEGGSPETLVRVTTHPRQGDDPPSSGRRPTLVPLTTIREKEERDEKNDEENDATPRVGGSIDRPVRKVRVPIEGPRDEAATDNAAYGPEGADRPKTPLPPARRSLAAMEPPSRRVQVRAELAVDPKTGRSLPQWEVDLLLSSRAKDERGIVGEGWTGEEFIARWRSVFWSTFEVEDLSTPTKADRVKVGRLVQQRLDSWFEGDRSRLWRYLKDAARWWKERADAEMTFPSGLPSIATLLDRRKAGGTNTYFEQWRAGSFKRDVAEMRSRA